MKIGVVIPVYNEQDRIGDVLAKFKPGIVDAVIVVDDGSTDETREMARRHGAGLLVHPQRSGVGSAIRDGLERLRSEHFDAAVVMAGNGKDDPGEIPRLKALLASGETDYVQGSRFLEGGGFRNLPWTRYVMIKSYTFLWSLLLGRWLTDVTNGFRAYRLDLLEDARIRLGQSWLDAYDLEYYLQYKVLSLGYRFREVPVSKNYPSRSNYTKIRPLLDWWSIVRPLFFLRLGIRS